MSLFEQSVHRTSDGRVFIWLAPAGCEPYSHDPGLHLVIEQDTEIRLSVGLDVADEDGRVRVSAKLPFTPYVSAAFGAGPGFSDRLRNFFRIPGYESRKVSVTITDGVLMWNLWKDPDSWSSTDPKWRGGMFDPLDTFFGLAERTRHTKIASTKFTIPMPEGDYPATVTLYRSEYTRPRWPFRFGPLHTELTVGDVEIEGGIPFPGKGENAHDCGDDALHSWHGPAASLEDAIGKTVASVLHTRRKRSGTYWFGPTEPDAAFLDYDGSEDEHDDGEHDDDWVCGDCGVDQGDEHTALRHECADDGLLRDAKERDRLIANVVCFTCVDFEWKQAHQPIVLPSPRPGYTGHIHHPDCPKMKPPENDK